MQNASVQVDHSGTSSSVLTGKKTGKGQASLGDLVGNNNNDDAFKAMLLGGLAKSRANAVAQNTQTANAAATTKTDLASLLAQTGVTPELLGTLKNMTAADLKNLPPQLSALLGQHMTAEGKLDDATQNLLDTLSAAVSDSTGKLGDLVKSITDPDQTSFLTSLASALSAAQNPVTTAVDADQYTQLFGNVIATTLGTSAKVTSAAVSSDGITLVTDKGTITVNVSDMNLDQFKAFKKLAFADLAPFLTQQRSVRVDAHTIMKMAQGPSFLDDENAPKVTYIHTADTAGSIPSSLVKGPSPQALAQLQGQLQAQANMTAGTPAFLDAAIVAKGAAAIAPQASTSTTQSLVLPTGTTGTASTHNAVAQTAANRANFFAALLGVPTQVQNNATQTTSQSPLLQDTQTIAGAAQQAVQMAGAQTQQPSTTAIAQQLTAAFALPGQRASTTGGLLKGLDTSLTKADADDGSSIFGAGLDSAFPIRSDMSTAAASASTLLAAKTATSMHPATYMVSMTMQRATDGAFVGSDRQFTIQLDPENLGKVKITLEFGENNTVKAKLVAERPETVALLQKDSGALQRSLHDSGFDVKADGLTFNLGDNGSFSGNMSQNGNSYQNNKNQASDEDGTDIATIHTVMPIFVDPVTGMTHVNIVV